MNKLYGDFLNKYRKAITSIDGNTISCKLKITKQNNRGYLCI